MSVVTSAVVPALGMMITRSGSASGRRGAPADRARRDPARRRLCRRPVTRCPPGHPRRRVCGGPNVTEQAPRRRCGASVSTPVRRVVGHVLRRAADAFLGEATEARSENVEPVVRGAPDAGGRLPAAVHGPCPAACARREPAGRASRRLSPLTSGGSVLLLVQMFGTCCMRGDVPAAGGDGQCG